MIFDVLIIGGGAAGISCGLVLGSAKEREFAKDKNIGIIMHQRASSLQTAILNNVMGVAPNTSGDDLLEDGKKQLASLYPHVSQIEKEKVLEIEKNGDVLKVITNKNSYEAKNIVVAVGPKNFAIKGLEAYTELHQKLPAAKQRTQLKNVDHVVDKGIYVAGTLAGCRSQFAIAAGSGAEVATDILTIWNDGKTTMIHDKKTVS
ncbi:FAD-dependent oxidoreductase [Aureivirga sp. CE67]|uniref:FAD-dependent oxidoreductase n=1 Tax=Aureivirga sp. CE67 TaxID=1788983 RepID=UPI0018CA68C8|nr:FAD-dependent oxidoreductase [Aureivirga sp. CE67]